MAIRLAAPVIDGAEIAKHNSPQSCWLVIHGKVYDVTNFLDRHPGGRSILLKQGGADATPEFDTIHSVDILQDLEDGSYKGELDAATATALNQPSPSETPAPTGSSTEPVPLALCVRAADFKTEAQKVLPRRTWIYITSSANSAQTLRENEASWTRVLFRPRIFRNVSNPSTWTSILGQPSIVPFFIPPMGTQGMTHPGAEPEMFRGAANKGVHAILSTASTKTPELIMDAHKQDLARTGGREKNPSRLFFQLYIADDRNKSVELVRKVREAGYYGLFITVDTAVLGKRTEDRRKQAEEALEDGRDHSTAAQPEGVDGSENPFAPAIGARPAPGSLTDTLTWEELEWIRKEWSGPIVLKGIQTAEDAKLAAENDVQGILLSNHGGRQQHTAPSALATLLEIRTYCPEVLEKMEVYLDGGLYDGADILKALALGATAVGIGRPFLYALGAYGSRGVEKLIDILQEELRLGMALLGVNRLDQLRPEMVNASRLLNEMWRPEIPSLLSRM